MPKSENVRKVAPKALRTAFSDLTVARQRKNEWIVEENAAKDTIRALTNDATGITFETPDGIEIGAINESDPKQPMDWKAFGESDYFQTMIANDPKLEVEVKKFLKPATTTVTIQAKYVDAGLQTKKPVKKTTAVN